MDKYHNQEHGHFCYFCGKRIYRDFEVDEEMCEECMIRQRERLKDLDYALPQEHGGNGDGK